MSDYKYPAKTARVYIYREKRVKVKAEGREGFALQRLYLNRRGKPFRAYCNPIVQEVSAQGTAEFPNEKVMVVINYRQGVAVGDYVEWGGRRMRITLPPDDFEGRHIELKLTCETLEAKRDEAILEEYPDE